MHLGAVYKAALLLLEVFPNTSSSSGSFIKTTLESYHGFVRPKGASHVRMDSVRPRKARCLSTRLRFFLKSLSLGPMEGVRHKIRIHSGHTVALRCPKPYGRPMFDPGVSVLWRTWHAPSKIGNTILSLVNTFQVRYKTALLLFNPVFL
jgi:hypothetical protein